MLGPVDRVLGVTPRTSPICRASSFTIRKLGMNNKAKASTAGGSQAAGHRSRQPIPQLGVEQLQHRDRHNHANSEMISWTKPRTKPMAAPPISSRKTKMSSAVIAARLAERFGAARVLSISGTGSRCSRFRTVGEAQEADDGSDGCGRWRQRAAGQVRP